MRTRRAEATRALLLDTAERLFALQGYDATGVRQIADEAGVNLGAIHYYWRTKDMLCRDALARDESCGCHFREEHQTEEGEAKRDDERFCHAAVWEYTGDDKAPLRHEEPLTYETVHLATRSYK